jgi:hypothetical protein
VSQKEYIQGRRVSAFDFMEAVARIVPVECHFADWFEFAFSKTPSIQL